MSGRVRPILFSAPMVRAILAGTKTQTRRVVKLRPSDGKCATDCSGVEPERAWADEGLGAGGYLKLPCKDGAAQRIRCPYGEPGDQLWVRETFKPPAAGRSEGPMYRAGENVGIDDDGRPWKPSIFMPRALSRLTLDVTGVRVERLQAISEEDAKAEGVKPQMFSETWSFYDSRIDVYSHVYVKPTEEDCAKHGWESVRHHPARQMFDAKHAYALLWDEINGPGAWAANPWVWVVSFRRVTP